MLPLVQMMENLSFGKLQHGGLSYQTISLVISNKSLEYVGPLKIGWYVLQEMDVLPILTSHLLQSHPWLWGSAILSHIKQSIVKFIAFVSSWVIKKLLCPSYAGAEMEV